MALTYDDVSAITNKWYSKMFPSLVFDENIVMSRLWKKGSKVEGGERIMVPIKYAYAKSGSYSPYEVFDVSGEANITSAEFLWKMYHGDITIENMELLKNDNALGIKKILDARMELAKDGIADSIATDMWSATATDSSKGLTSLQVMCDAAAGTLTGVTTYGGIARASYSWWAGNVISGGGGALTTASQGLTRQFSTVFGTLSDGSKHPTVICAHPTVIDKYMQEGIVSQHLYDEEAMKRGWLVSRWNSIPVVGDRHLPTYSTTAASNKVVFLNENYIDFISHKDQNMIFRPLAKPIDQEVSVGRFLWAGNVVCSAPKYSGILYNFTISYS
jgi:hypothetical protein